jgi:hypothetical protein
MTLLTVRARLDPLPHTGAERLLRAITANRAVRTPRSTGGMCED